MKTTLLLHGGRLKNKDARNDAYFQRLTRDLEDGDKLLWIGFARTGNDVEKAYVNEKSWILQQTRKSIEIVRADRESISDQITDAKVIHITGGDTNLLQGIMGDIPDFEGLIRGRLLGGSSAGALILCAWRYDNSTMSAKEGLNYLPFRLLVHYGNPEFGGTERALEILNEIEDSSRTLTLEEAEWQEFILPYERL